MPEKSNTTRNSSTAGQLKDDEKEELAEKVYQILLREITYENERLGK